MIIETSFGALPQADLTDAPLDDLIMAALPASLAAPPASPLHPTGTEPAELLPARPPRRLSDEEDEHGNIGDDDDDDNEDDEEEDNDDDEDEDEDKDDEDEEDEESDDSDEDEDEDSDDEDDDEEDEDEEDEDDDES